MERYEITINGLDGRERKLEGSFHGEDAMRRFVEQSCSEGETAEVRRVSREHNKNLAVKVKKQVMRDGIPVKVRSDKWFGTAGEFRDECKALGLSVVKLCGDYMVLA